MSSTKIIRGTADVATGALQHWLATPRNTRFGIDYGHTIDEWRHAPLYGLGPSRAHDALMSLRSDIAMFGTGGVPVDVHVREVRGDRCVALFELGLTGQSLVMYGGDA